MGVVIVLRVRDIRSDRQAVGLVTTAAVRAAVAWSQRQAHPAAWRELSRMTGVVVHALGPMHTPLEPTRLIELLHGPLSALVGSGSPVSEVVLLEPDGEVADAAIDIACEYAEALFENSSDPARTWLPSWTWQRREQVERSVYEGLIANGDQRAYEATRRFLIEHPVGDARSLVQLRNEAGARNVAEYSPIGPDRTWPGGGSAYWWPCPICRWPMRVKPPLVACDFRHHDARFRLVTPARHDDRPSLVALTVERLNTPVAVAADGSVCLAPSVWRHVTVPGISELATETALEEIKGVHVEMWLGLDAIDLLVQVGGRKLEVDIKDRVDPIMIAEDAPTAQHIVVPDYRRAQLPILRDLLSDKHIWTIREFVKYVRKQGDSR